MKEYKTVNTLFSAICNAIREKDGTSERIKHQDIPDRIMKIQVGGGVNKRYYIYKSGEEMNGHIMTIHQYYTNSKKTDGWLFVDLWYTQTVTSDLIAVDGHKRVGITVLAEGNKSTNNTRFTTFLMRDTPDVELSGYDYAPKGGTTYYKQDILRYPDTKTRTSGTYYFDIPDGLEGFYIAIQNVNVDLYIEEIWLE